MGNKALLATGVAGTAAGAAATLWFLDQHFNNGDVLLRNAVEDKHLIFQDVFDCNAVDCSHALIQSKDMDADTNPTTDLELSGVVSAVQIDDEALSEKKIERLKRYISDLYAAENVNVDSIHHHENEDGPDTLYFQFSDTNETESVVTEATNMINPGFVGAEKILKLAETSITPVAGASEQFTLTVTFNQASELEQETEALKLRLYQFLEGFGVLTEMEDGVEAEYALAGPSHKDKDNMMVGSRAFEITVNIHDEKQLQDLWALFKRQERGLSPSVA